MFNKLTQSAVQKIDGKRLELIEKLDKQLGVFEQNYKLYKDEINKYRRRDGSENDDALTASSMNDTISQLSTADELHRTLQSYLDNTRDAKMYE